MNTPTNASEARKLDTHFYADAEDGSWGVFGDNTGFCYELVMDKAEAEKMASEMNVRRLYAQREAALATLQGASRSGGEAEREASRAFEAADRAWRSFPAGSSSHFSAEASCDHFG